jgi:hypothetical protein
MYQKMMPTASNDSKNVMCSPYLMHIL